MLSDVKTKYQYLFVTVSSVKNNRKVKQCYVANIDRLMGLTILPSSEIFM